MRLFSRERRQAQNFRPGVQNQSRNNVSRNLELPTYPIEDLRIYRTLYKNEQQSIERLLFTGARKNCSSTERQFSISGREKRPRHILRSVRAIEMPTHVDRSILNRGLIERVIHGLERSIHPEPWGQAACERLLTSIAYESCSSVTRSSARPDETSANSIDDATLRPMAGRFTIVPTSQPLMWNALARRPNIHSRGKSSSRARKQPEPPHAKTLSEQIATRWCALQEGDWSARRGIERPPPDRAPPAVL